MPDDYLPTVTFVTPFCLLGLTTIAVAFRVGGKLAVERSFDWEDALICLSFLFAALLNLGCSLLTLIGLGRSIAKVDGDHVSTFAKAALFLGMCYSISLAVSKIVLVDQYLHLMVPPRAFRRLVLRRTCAAIFILQVAEEMIVMILSCHPILERALLQFHGECLSQRPMWFAGLILNLTFAVNLFVQPGLSLWSRRGLRLSQKIGPLVRIVVFGLLLVATTGRTITVARLGRDITYDYAAGILWSSAEADAIVICACLPYIKKTLQRSCGSTTEDIDKGKPMPDTNSADVSSADPRQGTEFRESHDSMRAQDKSHNPHEGELAMLPATLSPTSVEKVDWIQKVQAFPTEGRSQSRMASSEMGTTSRAEAHSAPGQWMQENTKGILVTTEVRREIVQDPSFPSISDVSCLGRDAATMNGVENHEGDVASLDELPLPEFAFGRLS